MTELSSTAAPQEGRLARLLPLLDADPENLTLLADAAETALAERRPEQAAELFARHEAIAPLPPREANLAGLAAMQMKQFGHAAEIFQRLFDDGERDSGLLFNLAWCRAMDKDFAGALQLLSNEIAAELPQAAMLQVQILHELGEFEDAAERARLYVELHCDYPPLMAAVSVLALDVEDEALAARCAAMAPDHPDALSTLGTLALGEERAEEALEMFNRALDRNPRVPRAWIGRGLAELLTGQAEQAAADIDRGAEMFGDHIGSWIAAGWAYFVQRDLAKSRERFEKALAIDANFAESHGSLAVLDILQGRIDEARQRTEVALRLDRQCYSAALAKMLLAAGAGDAATAQRIFERAINTPVDDSGRTIAHALARLGMG